MILADVHFLRPQWLLMLIPLIWLLWRLINNTQTNSQWQQICDAHLLPHVLYSPPTKNLFWPYALLACAWFLSCLAMAGPSWSQVPQPTYRLQQAKIIIFDLSRAMYATDIIPNRLTRARYKTLDILKQSQEGQVGLIVFTAEPHIVSPLTQDAATISAMIPALTPSIMPVPGSDIGRALQQAGKLFKQSGVTKGDIILITTNKATSHDLKIAKQLAQNGFKISVLGVGTTEGAPIPGEQSYLQNTQGNIQFVSLDRTSLQDLAQHGQGSYVDLSNDDRDINTLLANNKKINLKPELAKANNTANIWVDQGRWFIFPLIPLALLIFRRGWLNEVIR